MLEDLYNTDVMFTLNQALQLVGLAPTLFVIALLSSISRYNSQTIIPICYFLSLACGFVLPLLAAYPHIEENIWVHGSFLMGESLLVAFCFLLICQFIFGHIPSWQYWMVLAIPVLGGGTILYASMLNTEVCYRDACIDGGDIKSLYHIISSLVMFLLLNIYCSRYDHVSGDSSQKRHKYWLMIALITLHLCMLVLSLLLLSQHITLAKADIALTVLRIGFIYLVLTSLFRVFYPSLVTEIITAAKSQTFNPDMDEPNIRRIETLLGGEKLYREMRLNRAMLADKLGVTEHYLSRIINQRYGKNFNDMVNTYRIEEAKSRLLNEPDQQVTVIGFEVGFNSIASFNRVFKNTVGKSPTEFRAC